MFFLDRKRNESVRSPGISEKPIGEEGREALKPLKTILDMEEMI
jgi:hypothetical protein